jgi:DNA replicative helicase MCM subunit Mcm2 (Cdc46/Mcm family)
VVELIDNVTTFDIYNTLSKRDRILFILYNNKDISQEKIEELLSYNSNNSYNGYINKNICNQSNQSNESNEVTVHRKSIIDIIEDGLILQNKYNIPRTFSLTDLGIKFVEDLVKPELDKIIDKQKRRQEVEKKEELNHLFLTYCDSIEQTIIESKDKGYLNINGKNLALFNPILCDYMLDFPEEFSDRIEMYLNINAKAYDLPNNFKITINNLPNSSNINITEIRNKNKDKMISFIGEIRSRGSSELLLKSIKWECPSCGNIFNTPQNESKIVEPSKCGCGRKGKFKNIGEETEDFLKITVSDLYENLRMDQIPEEINVLFEKDIFGFDSISEGSKVRITGILKTKIEDNKTNIKKYIFCKGVERLDLKFSNITITETDKEKLQEINKNPIQFYFENVYNDIVDCDTAKKLAILSLYDGLNLLFLGDSGTGKSLISKRTIKYSLKGTHIDAMKTSKSGLSGATTKNEFTGKFGVDSGALRRIHPNGICSIDELQFNEELQKDLYGILQDKRVRIVKANVDVQFNCDINIIASANPVCDNYSEEWPLDKIFNIKKALIDRFSFTVFFKRQLLTEKNIISMSSLKYQKDFEYSIEENDILDILKKHQIESRKIDVILTSEDYKNIGIWITKFWQQIKKSPPSNRAPSQIANILKSLCKLHQRDHTVKEDYVFMSDLFLELQNNKDEFFPKELDRLDNKLEYFRGN